MSAQLDRIPQGMLASRHVPRSERSSVPTRNGSFLEKLALLLDRIRLSIVDSRCLDHNHGGAGIL
ncbi:MAG: hypothetical protein K0S78_4209 [Thermomicrobiales bacterium]|nr:hypothetical protein [Thermomicrobiales bacterium]